MQTLTLTAEQSEALMPLHLEAASTGGSVMCGIERASFDQPDAGQLVLRARVATGEEKQGMIRVLEKLRAKEEARI